MAKLSYTSVAQIKRSEITSALVRSNAKVSSRSVFSDLIWDRREYKESRTQWKGARIHWEDFFEKYGNTHSTLIISIMEFAYALLFDPVEDDYQKDTKSVLNTIRCLTEFLSYLQLKHIYNVYDFTHDDMQKFVVWLLKRRSESTYKKIDSDESAIEWASHRVRALQAYYRYGKRLSQPLLVFPLNGQSLYNHLGKRRGRKRGENTTPIIPKLVWDPYLCAALDYVEFYAPDILCGQAELERIRAKVLPDFAVRPKFNGANFVSQKASPILRDLAQEFVLDPKTGVQWRNGWRSCEDLRIELQALYHACLVVIGCLSGLRESELSLIEVDGFWEQSVVDGSSKRYVIVSRLTKGDGDKREQWEVNEPVYRACNIVKNLTAYARSHVSYKELFIQGWNLPVSRQPTPEVRVMKDGKLSGRWTAILPIGPSAFNSYLNHFARHLDKAFDGRYRLPLVDGRVWNFITRMLRRSLAGRIAKEPFGMIAGMLHYKHVKITTFQGYAGSDPGWIQELHDEEIAANEEFLEHIWEDLQDGALGGAKGEELVREFRGMAGDLKRNALQYFIENNRANLHVGFLNYCVFQKERALCLTGKSQLSEDAPVLNACHPDRCANSCVSRRHLPQWEVQVSEARAMLSHKRVSEPQRIALSHDLEKATRVVKQLKGSV